jgi:uridylate kinase
MSDFSKTIVISLGGSLVVPSTVDTLFLSKLKVLVEKKISQGFRFLFIVGGGKICRTYQEALSEVRPTTTTEDLDWLGIYTTQFNAQLVRLVFKDDADQNVAGDPYDVGSITAPIIIAAGARPGSSTDLGAIRAAEKLGAHHVINLSNISHVYDMDPRENPQAQKFETLSWQQYRSFIPTEWTPGLSTPFDPIAAKKAEELGITVAIMSGDLENFERYLDGQEFVGTVISS